MDIDWKSLSLLVGVVVTWSGVLLKSLDWMLKRNLEIFEEKFSGVLRRIEKLEAAVEACVKHEDYVRLSTTFEAKFDVVSARLDVLLMTMRQRDAE